MAVEIRILSGARQGERLVLEGRELRVGADRNCEVAFDAARDPAIRGRTAVLRLGDDGWCLHATGGRVWLNQEPVTRSAPLHSGDVVRMSESGPEFSFGILAAAAPAAAGPWWTGPVDVPGRSDVGKTAQHLLAQRPSGGQPGEAPGVGVKTPSPGVPAPMSPVPISPLSMPVASAAGARAAADPQAAVGNQSASQVSNLPHAPYAAARTTAESGPQLSQPGGPASSGRYWPAWLAGGIGLVILLLLLARSFFPTIIVVNGGQQGPAATPSGSLLPGSFAPTASTAPGAPGAAMVPDAAVAPGPAVGPRATGAPGMAAAPGATSNEKPPPLPAANAEPPASPTGGEDREPPAQPKDVVPTPKDRDEKLRAKLDGSVYLIEVEKPGGASSSFWPLATCVAVGDKVLLTTAREAAQLAQWRQQKTFDRIWVARPSAGVKAQVEDIRVAADYAAAPETGDDWIYVNLGLLTVRDKLPGVATLATPAELAKLKLGTVVGCFGFSPEAKVITEDDTYKPLLTRGQVLRIAVSTNLPAQPWRLYVQAELPPNLYGSAVVNADGKLVGLYAEKEPPPSGAAGAAGLKDLHFVTLINPTAIDQALRDPGSKAWVSPAAGPNTKTPAGG